MFTVSYETDDEANRLRTRFDAAAVHRPAADGPFAAGGQCIDILGGQRIVAR